MPFYTPNFQTIKFIDRMMAEGENHLRKRGFVKVAVPRIVPASGACENVDTLFEVGVSGNRRWFSGGKKRAYFAQTGQLYLESLLGNGGFEKVYCVGPSGRAEPDVDTRHLTEFEMIEIEFRGNFDELLKEIEWFIGSLVKATLSLARDAGRKDFSHLENHQIVFPKIKYKEAIAELKLEWGSDLSSREEQQLIANHGGGPIFITHFPNPENKRMKRLIEKGGQKLAIKFFNMQPEPTDPDYVQSADCVVPYGGECVGSAARVWQLSEFRKRLYQSLMFQRLKQKDPAAKDGFSWYLGMLKRFPSHPHAGCGFGMSRIFQYLLAEKDITQAVTFPSNRARIY